LTDTPDISEFHCTDCGKCCLEGASRLQANDADIRRWQADAPHVIEHMEAGTGGLWVSPKTGKPTTRCPWIRKKPLRDQYYCRIYDVRPDVCRRYPTSPEHAEFTGCPGTFL